MSSDYPTKRQNGKGKFQRKSERDTSRFASPSPSSSSYTGTRSNFVSAPRNRDLQAHQALVVQALINGRNFVSSFPGTSQYSEFHLHYIHTHRPDRLESVSDLGAPSACGLASLNAVRILLTREQEDCEGVELLDAMSTRRFHEVRSSGTIESSSEPNSRYRKWLQYVRRSGALHIFKSRTYISFPSSCRIWNWCRLSRNYVTLRHSRICSSGLITLSSLRHVNLIYTHFD